MWLRMRELKQKTKDVVEFMGMRYERLLDKDVDDIRQFYSRVHDAFKGGRHIGFLLHDSLVRTLASKHKLSSRRKEIKKYDFLRGQHNWYVPNQERHVRFQNHRPVPFRPIDCKRENQKACWRVKEAGEADADELYLLPHEVKYATEKNPLNKRSKSRSHQLRMRMTTKKF